MSVGHFASQNRHRWRIKTEDEGCTWLADGLVLRAWGAEVALVTLGAIDGGVCVWTEVAGQTQVTVRPVGGSLLGPTQMFQFEIRQRLLSFKDYNIIIILSTNMGWMYPGFIVGFWITAARASQILLYRCQTPVNILNLQCPNHNN